MVVWIGALYTCKNYEGFYDNQIRLSLDNILKMTQPKKKSGERKWRVLMLLTYSCRLPLLALYGFSFHRPQPCSSIQDEIRECHATLYLFTFVCESLLKPGLVVQQISVYSWARGKIFSRFQCMRTIWINNPAVVEYRYLPSQELWRVIRLIYFENQIIPLLFVSIENELCFVDFAMQYLLQR